jgi:hypothetical protein
MFRDVSRPRGRQATMAYAKWQTIVVAPSPSNVDHLLYSRYTSTLYPDNIPAEDATSIRCLKVIPEEFRHYFGSRDIRAWFLGRADLK